MTDLSQLVFEKRDGFRITEEGEFSSNDVSWIFVLSGPEGATTFDVTRARKGTGIAKIYDEFPDMHPADESGARWFAWDIGFHSVAELEYAYLVDKCEIIGQSCWYDGSGLWAEEVLKTWMQSGMDNEVVRLALESWYTVHLLEREFDGEQ